MKRQTCLGTVIAATVVLFAGIVAERSTSAEWESPRYLPPDRIQEVLYVALGDSTVYGVGAGSRESTYVGRLYERLRSEYPHARFVNLGVGGATATDVLKAQLQRAVALRPDLVTLSVGPNDITQEKDVHRYEREIETTLQTLMCRTTAVVVINLIPDLTVTPRYRDNKRAATIGRRVVAFNEALGRQARAFGAEVVDLYGPSQQEVPRHPELIGADGYHPSDQGYARWAELMWQGVEARIQR